jgi:hypothetical protein
MHTIAICLYCIIYLDYKVEGKTQYDYKWCAMSQRKISQFHYNAMMMLIAVKDCLRMDTRCLA